MMKRITLDRAAPTVQQFVRSLPVDPDGVELVLKGCVLCKIVPSTQFSEAEKATLLEEGRELVRRARERNKSVPPQVIEREVRRAVDRVSA